MKKYSLKSVEHKSVQRMSGQNGDQQGQPESDWVKRFPKWRDIGDQYNQGLPEETWSEVFEIGLGPIDALFPINDIPLPSDEIKYCEDNGIKFENEKLGKGSFGHVWLASFQGKQIACKIMHLKTFAPTFSWFETITVKNAVQDMIREAEFHHNLVHRNIVRCEHFFNIPDSKTGFPYVRFLLFMELCEGTLWKMILDKLLTEQQTKDMLRDLTAGLRYLHDHNICHIDLKPDNIMYVKEQGDKLCYKLTDFGLSKRFNPSSDYDPKRDGMPEGIKPYRAPELSNASTVNLPLCDVYSLGWCTGEAMLGPRGVIAPLRWYDDLTNAEFSAKYGISVPMVLLLRGMTAKDPTKRITLNQIIDFLVRDSAAL